MSFPVPPPRTGFPREYGAVLREIKRRIQRTRLGAVLAANAAVIALYWEIGALILARQGREGWGAKVIDRLATDLREA